jgi:aminopeptidase C
MFVVNKDYMDCATHYVRMHGYSQISEGGSCDDVLEVIRQHGICPENAMPAPGSLTGDSLANFKVFFPELERKVSSIVVKDAKEPMPHWKDSIQDVIERYVGRCPESFEYEGKTYTPKSFAESLGLDFDDYVSLTSYTHHPFNKWFVIEAPYKWRLKPSYNIPIERLILETLPLAIDAGYTVAWAGDVTGYFTDTGYAILPDSIQPTQKMRQEQWDNWEFTYDHAMLIFGMAVDKQGKYYYIVKNSWGEIGDFDGVWIMSEDYMLLYTTYLFLNRHALPKDLREAIKTSVFH